MADTQQNIVEAAIFVFNEDYSAPLERVAERAAVPVGRYTATLRAATSCWPAASRKCAAVAARL